MWVSRATWFGWHDMYSKEPPHPSSPQMHRLRDDATVATDQELEMGAGEATIPTLLSAGSAEQWVEAALHPWPDYRPPVAVAYQDSGVGGNHAIGAQQKQPCSERAVESAGSPKAWPAPFHSPSASSSDGHAVSRTLCGCANVEASLLRTAALCSVMHGTPSVGLGACLASIWRWYGSRILLEQGEEQHKDLALSAGGGDEKAVEHNGASAWRLLETYT